MATTTKQVKATEASKVRGNAGKPAPDETSGAAYDRVDSYLDKQVKDLSPAGRDWLLRKLSRTTYTRAQAEK